MDATAIATSVVTTIATSIIIHYIKNIIDSRATAKRKRKAVLAALIAELESLFDLIKNRLGQVRDLPMENKPLVTIPIYNNYFRVFDGLAPDLSAIDSTELASRVIRTYMEVKGLYDDVIGFSTLSLELIKLLTTENETASPRVQRYIQSQISYFDNLTQRDAPKVLQGMESLIQDLKTEHKK